MAGAIHEATTIENQSREGRGGEGGSALVHHRDSAPGGSLFSRRKARIHERPFL